MTYVCIIHTCVEVLSVDPFYSLHTHVLACASDSHTCHIQIPLSIADELLPARDKSPPVCGITVAVHVGARPNPPADELSPTT